MNLIKRAYNRWTISLTGHSSLFDHDKATRIKRYLRHWLPADTEYLALDYLDAAILMRLGVILGTASIAVGMMRMQPEIYGGAVYQIRMSSLREAVWA